MTDSDTLTWQPPQTMAHWLKHSAMPLVLLAIFLLLPHPWSLLQLESPPVLTLELIEEAPPVIDLGPKPIKPLPIEPTREPSTQPTNPEPASTAPPIATAAPTPIAPQPSTEAKPASESPAPATTLTTVTGAQLIEQSQNSPSIDITPEFEARQGPATDFFRPAVKVTDWYADIPYLDESVDKPQLQMRFYAAGIEGSVERFFDRITVTKTFTTKYGTKIHCAWVGVIVSCGWK